MANSGFSVVRGKRIRATRVGNCALPIQGEGSTLVTDGFVTVNFTRVNKDAEDLEQTNADGQVCVADRTAPELKWYEVSIEFCNVNPELFSFFTDDRLVLDYKQDAVGVRFSKNVKVDSGVGLELWTGTGSEDCEVPDSDDILTPGANAVNYGYWLAPWIKEATLGDIEIGASVATFTLTGITGSPVNWGRGPYNVVAMDELNTPGRLLTPMGKEHLHVQRTTIAPPEVTDGAVALTLPQPFFGDDAADVAGGEPVGE